MKWFPRINLFSSRANPPATIAPRRSTAPLLARWRHLLPTLWQWLSYAFLAAVIGIPLGLFTWLIFFKDTFHVQAITVIDARQHVTEATSTLITQAVARAPLGKNIFFIDTDTIEKNIVNQIPEIRTVHVTRKLPGTIKAIVQEKEPVLRLLSGTRYYFVDDKGIAYEEARLETLPDHFLLTVKNNDQGAQVTLGAPVVSPPFVEFIQYMQEELPQATGAQVVEIRIPSLSAREVHFYLNNNWQVRFDITRSAARQLTTLKQLLAGTITPEEQASLEYIDLRILDRVYYKTRSAAPVETPISSPKKTVEPISE